MGEARILELRTLHQGYLKLYRARVRLPDGAVVERELSHAGDAACVLPYDPVRRLALVITTPRIPVLQALGPGHPLAEAPAGMLDGDTPQACVRREAMEEAGLQLRDLEPVACVWPSPGTSMERISLYLAAYDAADRTGPGGGALGEHENISVSEVPLAELWASMGGEAAIDLKTLALVQALRLRRPHLFE